MEKNNEILAPSSVIVLVLNDSAALNKLRTYVEKEHLTATTTKVGVDSLKKACLPKYVFIQGNNSCYNKIERKNILYIKASRDYSEIYVHDKNEVKCNLVSCPMKGVLNNLHDEEFVQVHRSYTINLEHVKCYFGKYLSMDNGDIIPIGRDFRLKTREKIIVLGPRKKINRCAISYSNI
jgi:DNA-binding LytR/AlgR family response regulator